MPTPPNSIVLPPDYKSLFRFAAAQIDLPTVEHLDEQREIQVFLTHLNLALQAASDAADIEHLRSKCRLIADEGASLIVHRQAREEKQ